ncbi:Ig-like domain-containing protein [Paenibacillus sp. 1001270B_150601_E10]|uniref:Ig-like domain-containing protein n=1 Tax=Paenibacillus sp. 1001270B_150601_E10 TaxID=2787079 RepID=UPI0018A121EE|nr:Ig-like domain-containing protein [Paenibacillus sp. 1001270B_150601_E10]
MTLADAATGEFRYVPYSGMFGKEEISFEVSNGIETKTGKAVFYISKQGDSFIQNSGFETGSATGWPVVSSTVKVVEGQSYSGKYAIQFERASTSLEQTVQGLKPNQWYVLEAWGKSERADNYQRIGVKRYDSSGLQQVADINSLNYTRLKVPFKTGPSQTTATVFGYKRPSSAAPPSSIDGVKAWLDDFGIREYQPPTAEPTAFDMKAGQVYNGAVQGESTESEELQYHLVSKPLQGTLQWNETTGDFVYTARSDASGTDQWTFIARDERSESLPAAVTVRFSPAAYVVSINAIPDHLVLKVGDTESTVVQAVYSDGQQVVLTEGLTFTAIDPTLISILDGYITGLRIGKTEVMLTWNGFTDRIAIQIESPPIEKLPIRLSFNEKKPMLRVGENVRVIPTIHYDDGTSAIADSASVTYRITDKEIATIDENGVIHGIAKGKTMLTIQCGKLTETLEVMVKKEK